MNPQQIVSSGDVALAVYTWGKRGPKAKPKPVVVLVHGYPDSAHVWKTTAELLAQRYFVIAYDVRGAGRSTRPSAVPAYDIAHLMDDLSAVVDALSPDRPVHLVCHDWGSIQCWEAVTTERMQDRIASYTTISGPSLDHAAHWIKARLKSGSPEKMAQVARQLMHSWYAIMFQLPLLGPGIWRLGMDKLWPKLLERAEGIKDAEPSRTQREDGALGVNLYRANFIKRLLKPQERRTNIPVQLILPTRDKFMVKEIWDDLPQWTSQLWRREADAGHWIQVSHPQLITKWATEFIDFVEGGKASAALRLARIDAAA